MIVNTIHKTRYLFIVCTLKIMNRNKGFDFRFDNFNEIYYRDAVRFSNPGGQAVMWWALSAPLAWLE